MRQARLVVLSYCLLVTLNDESGWTRRVIGFTRMSDALRCCDDWLDYGEWTEAL